MKIILFACLFFFSFLVLAAPSHIGNVKGYTLNNAGELIHFSNMVFDGGKVVAIGAEELSQTYPNATFIDGQNKVLLPGLIDAHGHVMGLGETLLEVDLRESQSALDAAKMVQAYAKNQQGLAWITGRGWNQVLWPGKAYPTANLLDEYVNVQKHRDLLEKEKLEASTRKEDLERREVALKKHENLSLERDIDLSHRESDIEKKEAHLNLLENSLQEQHAELQQDQEKNSAKEAGLRAKEHDLHVKSMKVDSATAIQRVIRQALLRKASLNSKKLVVELETVKTLICISRIGR